MKDLNLMLTITRRSDEEEFSAFFRANCLSSVFALPADGTTNSHTLSLLGIERTEKTVFLAVTSGDTARSLIKGLRRQMYLDLPDRGVAVFCPLASVGGNAALSSLTRGEINEKDANEMNTEHELIVIIANRDSTDLVMNAAREGGAGGGTVLHALGTAGNGTETFFGMSIAEEREILLIVAKGGETRNAIIRSIMKNAGPGTPAGALAFSLPITKAAGFASLNLSEEEEEDE